MQKADKVRVVEELTSRLQSADALLVADYRGLTNSQLAGLRVELLKHGAKFTVVKNTLARRAAEASGSEALLAMLEGPTAIAFVGAEGNPVAVAKALSDVSRDTKILALRGGVLSGLPITGAEIETLAKLPPLDVLQAQLVGVIVAPLTQLVAVLNAPLQNLMGLIDARIAQLEEGGDTSATAAVATPDETVAEPEAAEAPAAEVAEDAAAQAQAAEAPAETVAEEAAEAEPVATVTEPPATEPAAEEGGGEEGGADEVVAQAEADESAPEAAEETPEA